MIPSIFSCYFNCFGRCLFDVPSFFLFSVLLKSVKTIFTLGQGFICEGVLCVREREGGGGGVEEDQAIPLQR